MKLISKCVFVFLILVSTPAWADEASKNAKVEEFIRLAGLEQTYVRMISMISEQAKAIAIGQMPAEERSSAMEADLDSYLKEANAIIAKYMSWERLKPEYVKLYAEAYEEEDIDALVAFYGSPVGQRMVAKTPELMMKSAEVSQRFMTEATPAIHELTQGWLKRMEKQPPQP
jgi:hypothetical protein